MTTANQIGFIYPAVGSSATVVPQQKPIHYDAATLEVYQQQQQQDGDDGYNYDEYDDDEEEYYEEVDYAELQRQDAEYESQLEQQDMYLPTATSYQRQTMPTASVVKVLDAPVYYNSATCHQTEANPSRPCSTLVLDPGHLEDVGAGLEGLLNLRWADDDDEPGEGRSLFSPVPEADSEGSPHDSDFFDLSSTSSTAGSMSGGSINTVPSTSPTKCLRSNTSFGAFPLMAITVTAAGQAAEEELESEDLSVVDRVSPTRANLGEATTTPPDAISPTVAPAMSVTYCNNGYQQYHAYLDLDEQRSLVAEDTWRANTLWVEREAEAAKMTPANRKIAVKILIQEAYRLDKLHAQSRFGAGSDEVLQVQSAWRVIAAAAMADMEVQYSPAFAFHQPQENSATVMGKFSSMGIFIAGQGSRHYGENDAGKFQRLEQQAITLDSLIFAHRLFCDDSGETAYSE